MNIVLDGLSGVGKTHIGEKLAVMLNTNFYEFLPDTTNNSESSLHSYAIQRQSKNDQIIIEGSYLMSEITKDWMVKKGKISFDEYLRVKSLPTDQIKPFIIIYLDDHYSKILERRKQRGRAFEFLPTMTPNELQDLDNYITQNYDRIVRARNVTRVTLYRTNPNGTNRSADDMVKLIYKYLITHLSHY